MAPEPFHLEVSPVDQYPKIVSDLRETFNSGLTRDLAYRKQQLRRAWEFLDENTDAIAKAIYQDLRKPMQEALGTEIAPCKEELLYFINNLDRLSKPETVKGRYIINALEKKYIRKDALGVVLLMSAWNYPIQLVFLPLAGALATGNVVIIKPAELSPHVAALLAELLPRYLDPRSYRVVNGGIPETTTLLTHRFDFIFYTGNGQVGKVILAAASKHLTPVMLELGGKSPAIVMPDSDLQLTANRIGFGRWLNCGQLCVCPDYALVHESVVEPFVAALKKSSERFYGENPQKSEYYARIINERHFNRLTKMLESTTGRVVVGGQHDKDDLFFAPSVVTGFTDIENEPLMQHEIFGPILPVIPVSDVEEAIRFVNNRERPLALYLFTNNQKTINQVLDNTNSGGATVNDTLMHVQELNMTFGGVGSSGMGKYHGDSSYDVFTHRRAIMIKKQNLEEAGGAVKYPPYSQASVDILTFFTVSVPSWKGFSAKFSATMTGLMAIVKLIMGKTD